MAMEAPVVAIMSSECPALPASAVSSDFASAERAPGFKPPIA